jgi:small subunit ribosomal protein S16
MPVKLRLRRQGRRKHPHYAIVAADSRSPRDGRYIEKIGFYDPVSEPARVFLDHDLAIKWLKVGAQPTNTVRDLLRHTGATVRFALIKQGKTEEEIERIYGKWRSEKDGKAKKKVISVDVHSTPLEPIPGQKDKVVAERKPLVVEANIPAPILEDEAPEVELTAPEVEPVEKAAAPEAKEEAPAAETKAEAPAPEAKAEEPAPEAKAEEPAPEAKEEAPAAEEEKKKTEE